MSVTTVILRTRQISRSAAHEPHPKGGINDWCWSSKLFQGQDGVFVASISILFFRAGHFLRYPHRSRSDWIRGLECIAWDRFKCPCVSWVERLWFNMRDGLFSRSPEVPIRHIKCMSAFPLQDDVRSLFIYLWLLLTILTNRLSIHGVWRKFIYMVLSIARLFL